jgi:hypothetical protein
MLSSNYNRILTNEPPFFPSMRSMERKELPLIPLNNQSQEDRCKTTKQIWTSSDLLQIFNEYKKYGNQWSIISLAFKEINSQNIKNRFFGLARRALRMMMKLLDRKGEGSRTDFVSSIHTKTLVLGINHVVKFRGKRREVVMLDVIKKYAFIRNFKPEYVASKDERAFLKNCVEYFLKLNCIIMGRSRILQAKRISKVRNVPFKFYKNDRKVNFRQFLEKRRSGFKRANLNHKTVNHQKLVKGFKKMVTKPGIMIQALNSNTSIVNNQDKERKEGNTFTCMMTRKWSDSTEVKSNISDDKVCAKLEIEKPYGVIRFQSGDEFDLLSHFKQTLSRQNTKEFEPTSLQLYQ